MFERGRRGPLPEQKILLKSRVSPSSTEEAATLQYTDNFKIFMDFGWRKEKGNMYEAYSDFRNQPVCVDEFVYSP